jgi:hypothetical protein
MKSVVLLLSIKSKILLIVALVALMAAPQVILAAPVKLVFEGTVNHIDANNFSLTPYGISAGSSVSFTYIVDLAQPGAFADYSVYDAFYATQVGGLRILGDTEDVYRGGYRNKSWNQTYLYTGTGKESNDWWSNEEVLPEGQYFYVGQYFYGNGGLLHPSDPEYSPYAFVRYDLLITSMSAVPIPGAVWLFAPALAGLVGLRRRFKV